MDVTFLLVCFVVGRSMAESSTGPASTDSGRLPVEENDRPVIGILSMELSSKIRKVCGNHDSYIAASYVKFVEGAGAQVAPILIGQPPEYYQRMLQGVNGLLLPGGATYLDEENGYGAAGKELYRLATEMNESGVHFPILGICLGMELLAVAAAEQTILEDCHSETPLPLTFLPSTKLNSRMFANAPQGVLNALSRQNITVHHHRKCVTRKGMESCGLDRDWRTLAVNKDDNDFEFVSAFEHRHLPIYGVMFHPEKTIYEWRKTKNYPHSASAIAASRHFADLLVSEARRNRHSFANDERDNIIYKNQPSDTRGQLMWEQLYFFSHPISKTATTAENKLFSVATTTDAPREDHLALTLRERSDDDFDI